MKIAMTDRRATRGSLRNIILGTTALIAFPAHAAEYVVTDAASLTAAILASNASEEADTIIFANNIVANSLPVITGSLTINGAGYTLDGNSTRLFFIDAPNANINIVNFSSLYNGVAQGGDGSGLGGGGLGAGGAIFVNAGNVTVDNVNFNQNGAVGGAGGSMTGVATAAGGGGGLGGDGGTGSSTAAGGGGGFSGGGGGAGGTAVSQYNSYYSSYSGGTPAGAGGSGVTSDVNGGAGSSTVAGSGGFGSDAGLGGAAQSATTSSYSAGYYSPGYCYYSWWGGGSCYSGWYSPGNYSETSSIGGGGGGGGAAGGGDGGAGFASGSYALGGGGAGGGGLTGAGGDGGSNGNGFNGSYGGGGGGASGTSAAVVGGNGGTFGGGGGSYGVAGAGGFGGGGGGSLYGLGGAGGFGGGSGGSVYNSMVVGGGTGGGSGSANTSDPTLAGGGGGAGFGGAIFVNSGASITIGGNVQFSGSTAQGGAAGGLGATGGTGAGSDLFLMSGTTTTLAPGAGNVVTLTGTIADNSAFSLGTGTGAGATIAVGGGGMVQLNGQSSIAGGFQVGTDSALVVGSGGVIGAPGTAVQLVGGGSLFGNAGTVNGGANAVQVSADASVVNAAGGTISGTGSAILVDDGAHANIGLLSGSTTNGNVTVVGNGSADVTVDGMLNGGFFGGNGADVLYIGATGSVTAASSLGGGNDVLVLTNGGTHAGVDGGEGFDTLFLNGFTSYAAAGIDTLVSFEALGKTGSGTLTIDSVPVGFNQFYAGNGGNNEGVLAFSGTSSLTGDIYVNGAILRADTAGAFGTATIHTIDPTVQFGATGTYANNIQLEVAAPASADPTRLEAINGATATLTGVIATGTTPTTDPTQYVTIGGNGTIVLTNAANSWTGVTTVEAGASLVGTSSSISGGSIVNNGRLTYSQSSGGTVTQAISGTGPLYVNGLGANETLTFANSLTLNNIVSVDNSSVLFAAANSTGTVFVSGNDGEIIVGSDGSLTTSDPYGVYGVNGAVTVDNSGVIESTTGLGILLLGNGSSIVNREGAAIYGYQSGISNDNWTSVENSGTIRGTLFYGLAGLSLTVANTATGQIIGLGQQGPGYGIGIVTGQGMTLDNAGQIVGRFAGLSAGGSLTLSNSGLIGSGSLSGTTFSYSDGNDGIRSLAGGTIANLAGGQILGSISGIYHAAGSLSISNAGEVHGNQFGIYSQGGLLLDNLAGGVVSGTDRAIMAFNGATISNAAGGSIVGTNGAINAVGSEALTIDNAGDITGGINAVGGANVTVTNAATGQILGNSFGVQVDGTLILNNAGSIEGAATGNTAGIWASGGAATISNLAGGTIQGNAWGVAHASAAPLNLTNAGTIVGNIYNAVYAGFGSGNQVVNLVGGTLIGGNAAIYTDGANLTVNNAGTIRVVGGSDNSVISGIYSAAAGANITNTGTIESMLAAGNGIRLDQGGTITNLSGGVISGGADGSAIDLRGASVLNLAEGSIVNGRILVSGSGAVAANVAGVVNGSYDASAGTGSDQVILEATGTLANVALGGGDDSLTLRGGGLSGTADGGTGTDALTFDIASGTVSYNSAQFLGFESRTKTGAGTLSLSGVDALTADFTVTGGTLAVSGGSAINDAAAVSLASGTTLQLNSNEAIRTISGSGSVALGANVLGLVGNDSNSFAGIISGTGGLLKAGSGTLTLLGANTFTGGLQVSGGTVALGASERLANSLIVGVDTGATFNLAGYTETIGGLIGNGSVSLGSGQLIISSTANSQFGGVISGTGTLTKSGGGIFALTGANTYTGATSVTGGTLLVNGSLASIVTVGGGGIIGGNGTIGGLIVNSGGILAPGNSIGHLQVAGNVTFNAGSIYQVETTPTAADLTTATGNIVINGGTVQVLAGGATYSPITNYVILQAGGTVSGSFNGVTSNLAFLDPTLSYTSNQVRLTLRRNDIDFAEAANTTNQIAVANAVQGLESGTLFDAVLVQSDSGARMAFDALSGEIYATTPMLMAEENNRLAQAMRKAERRRAGSLLVWADASRSVGSHDGRMASGAAEARGDSTSLLGGVTYVSGGLSVSAGGGVANSDVKVGARSSKADIHSKLLGAEVTYAVPGVEVGGGITRSWHDVDTRRTVVFPGFADEVESSRDAKVTQFDLFAAAPTSVMGINVAPFAELSHQRIRLDDTVETGGEAALAIDAERFRSTRTLVGARIHHDISGWGGTITPRMSVGWEHLMGDRKGVMSASVDGSSRFIVEGVARSANAARVSAGIDGTFGNVRIGVGYDGRLATSDDHQSVNFNVGIRF